MSEETYVWIQTSAVEAALFQGADGSMSNESTRAAPRRNSARYDEEKIPDWGWHRGTIQSQTSSILEIAIRDDSSFHNRRSVTLALPEALQGENPSVVMANIYPSKNNNDGYEDEDEMDLDYPHDMIGLTHLHEPAVVHCLRARYQSDQIYTNTGPILLALNPFQHLPELYSSKVMQHYWQRGESKNLGLETSSEEWPPHVYGIADESYRTMMRHLEQLQSSSQQRSRRSSATKQSCNQSILVSGESGAGKTVTTKFIMQYLATLSERSSSNTPTTTAEKSKSSVEQQVLQSNPILESFGNARTLRNDNSSRFGKFIEIQFCHQGTLLGASIETYLLEKVRLLRQSEGERNFHVFYEIFCMTDEELQAYSLTGYTLDDFSMTNQSGTFDRRDGVEDFDTYDELRQAMETMGMTTEEQDDTFSIACAALHGSNMEFVGKSADESALAPTEDNPHLEPFLELLGLNQQDLDTALCYHKIQAGKEFHTRKLSKEKAEKGMDALIKAMYGALFTFLVRRINDSITVKQDNPRANRRNGASGASGRASAAAGNQATIGVLDIFGFESFQVNSFEQLCINYCNETLQQQFNLFVLKKEQEEYEREGIEWSFISFPDNQDALDLIAKKGSGIISILDDQCRAPGTTDKTFCNDLYRKCNDHPRFEADFRQVGAQLFAVKHYAGSVEYSTNGFVEKNRDDLPKEATDLLLSSKKEFVKQLAAILQNSSPGAPPASSRPTTPKRGGSAGTRVTVGGQFSRQLQELRNKIDLTTPHYIRCLKPNDLLIPDHFNPLNILEQLRCAGVIEAVRVSRAGFPQRYTHAAFLDRYKVLCIPELKKAAKGSRRIKPVNVLVNTVASKIQSIMAERDNAKHGKKVDANDAEETPVCLVSVGLQVGKTKIFLRQNAFEILEQLRNGKMVESAVKMQATARTYIERREYLCILQSTIMLQCLVRQKMASRVVSDARRNYRATMIQSSWRRFGAREYYVATLAVTRWLQKVQRGRKGRQRYAMLDWARKSIRIQRCWRGHRTYRMYKSYKDASLTIQCAVRCLRAKRELKSLRLGARDLQAVLSDRDKLRKENEELRKKLSATTTSDPPAAVKTVVEELSQEVNELQVMLEETRFREEEASAVADKAVADAEAAVSQATLANQAVEAAKKLQAETEKELTNAQQQLASREEEIKSLSAKLDRLEESTAQQNSGEEAHQAQVRTLELELEEAKKASSAALAQQNQNEEAHRAEVSALALDLEEAKKTANAAMDKESLLSREVENLTTENASLRKEVDSFALQDTVSTTLSTLDGSVKEISATKDGQEEANPFAEARSQLLQSAQTDNKWSFATLAEDSKGQGLSFSLERDAEIERLTNELNEVRISAALESSKAAEEIQRLEALLEESNIEQTDDSFVPFTFKAIQEDRPVDDESDEGVAEEILTLQDEVSRLNKELNEARSAMGDTDPNSPANLARRYDELRRLSDAGIEKDKEIERLKRQLEQRTDEQSHISDISSEHEDVYRLRQEILQLRGELYGQASVSHSQSDHSKFGKLSRKGFLGRIIDVGGDPATSSEEKELRKEIASLKSVNEMLRKEVEEGRKSKKRVEDALKFEEERGKMELEAFAGSLRQVDELRTAAELMSRELTRHGILPPSIFVSEDANGRSGTLQNTSQVLQRSTTHSRRRKPSRRGSSDASSIVSSFL